MSMCRDASLVVELSPNQSGHQRILVKITSSTHLLTRQGIEIDHTHHVEEEPADIVQTLINFIKLHYSPVNSHKDNIIINSELFRKLL